MQNTFLLVVLYCMCRNLPNICPWVNFTTERGEASENTLISLFEELLHVKHPPATHANIFVPIVYIWHVGRACVVLF